MFTRKSYFYLMISMFLAIMSCSEDDTSTNDPITQTVDPDPTEEVAIDPTVLSNGLIINNGTQINGDAPNPTGNLPFSLGFDSLLGFQKNGITINFDAPANYGDAYIQVTSDDGTAAPNYWDVTAFSPVKALGTLSLKDRKKPFPNRKNITDEQEIEINFEDNIPAGKFCYLICIYDSNGNISQPQEVCVTIEAWGGNPNLIGTWSLTKEDVTYDGETDTYITGEENCQVTTTVTCNNQTTLEIDGAYCETINLYSISFNADGTFSDIYNDTQRKYDSVATTENCQASYTTPEETNITSTGYWAYNEEDMKLTFIFFNEVYNGTTESYPNGRAYTVDLESVTNSTLILNDSGEETIKEYFTRQ